MQLLRRDGGIWIRPQTDGELDLLNALIASFGYKVPFDRLVCDVPPPPYVEDNQPPAAQKYSDFLAGFRARLMHELRTFILTNEEKASVLDAISKSQVTLDCAVPGCLEITIKPNRRDPVAIRSELGLQPEPPKGF